MMSVDVDKERSEIIQTLHRDNRRYIKALAMWQHWGFDIVGRALKHSRESLTLEINEQQQEQLRTEIHQKLTRWSASGRPAPKPALNFMEQAERAAKAWPGIVARMEADLRSKFPEAKIDRIGDTLLVDQLPVQEPKNDKPMKYWEALEDLASIIPTTVDQLREHLESREPFIQLEEIISTLKTKLEVLKAADEKLKGR
jgi:thymidylate synthase ThyX